MKTVKVEILRKEDIPLLETGIVDVVITGLCDICGKKASLSTTLLLSPDYRGDERGTVKDACNKMRNAKVSCRRHIIK